jgi:hypothetical protein
MRVRYDDSELGTVEVDIHDLGFAEVFHLLEGLFGGLEVRVIEPEKVEEQPKPVRDWEEAPRRRPTMSRTVPKPHEAAGVRPGHRRW